MQHPFERVPPDRRRRVMVALLVSTLACMGALHWIDASLKTAATPIGVVSFELCAWDGSCADAIAAYEQVPLQAGASIGLDYLFMPLYASTYAAALVFAAARRTRRMRRAAALAAWASFAAAALDAVENGALYAMLLTGEATPTLAWTASGSATAKFALLLLALLTLLAIPFAPRE